MYQKEAVKAAVTGLRGRQKRALVVMATGLGKTLTAAFAAKDLKPKRLLFLVHNNFILKHAIEQFQLVFDTKTRMATYNGLSKANVKKAHIIFASWQTMGKNFKEWRKNHFDLIIVDEAHHSEADTYKPTLRYFTGAKLGITATPDREDKRNIRNVFGPEVINITIEEAIARGWLPRIEYHVITDQNLNDESLQEIASEIQLGKKRFSLKEVNKRIFIKKRDEEIAKQINRFNEKAIVFCSSIAYANRMAKYLEHAESFHSKKGKTIQHTWKKNRATLEDLKHGVIRKVCAVDGFNEGIDVPTVGLVAFCRVTEVINVFRQQLGRGLRPGKDKLIVLDFVGNLERIQMLMQMVNKISELHEKYTSVEEMKREGYTRDRFEVSGKGFEFTFSDKIVDMMKIIEHCGRTFYSTYQEAASASQKLGILSSTDYKINYRYDDRLPARPELMYQDFPGWRIFLGTGTERLRTIRVIYPKCKQASVAAIRLGITTMAEYKKMYVKDPRLPSCPDKTYSEFQNWFKFLGKKGGMRFKEDVYSSMQQASKAARRLGITGYESYHFKYKQDPRLPSTPNVTYPDWQGWHKFLGRKPFYPTLGKAYGACIRLGITNRSTYKHLYKKDPRLPSNPNRTYPNWPGWKKFLSKIAAVYVIMLSLLLTSCSSDRKIVMDIGGASVRPASEELKDKSESQFVHDSDVARQQPNDLLVVPKDLNWKIEVLDTCPDQFKLVRVAPCRSVKQFFRDRTSLNKFLSLLQNTDSATFVKRNKVDTAAGLDDSTLDKMRKGRILK